MAEKSPIKRRRLSPEARRAQIIETARTVFSESGANRTRIWKIAEQAGITEPFLYRHFESREELFKLAILDPLDAVVDKLAQQIRELAARSDIELSELLFRFHELFLRDVIEMIPLIAAAQFSDPVEGPQFYSDTLFPKIRDNIVTLMSRFTGWEADSIEMDLAIQALMGVHVGIALETILSGGSIDTERVAKDLTRMFGPGLAHARSASKRAAGGAKRKQSAAPVIASARRAAVADIPADPERKRLSRAERSDAILAAARTIFLQYGLTGARSKQIAQEAGITEAFMFRLFESKEQMYEAAILEPLEAAFATLAQQVKEIGKLSTGAEFLTKLNRIMLPFFIENGPLCATALFSELAEGQRYYQQALLPHLNTMRKVIVARIGRIDPEVDPETVRRAIIGAQWGISFDYTLRFQMLKTDEVVSILTRLFTVGVQSKVRF